MDFSGMLFDNEYPDAFFLVVSIQNGKFIG